MKALQHPAGKVAVVTGGASGIGKAIARRLKAEGMQVIISDIEREALDLAADELGVTGIAADVSLRESVQALADEVRARFGRVDLFCSNAGVASTARIEDMELADWQWLFGVNFYGAINGLKAFLPMLRANPEGGYLAVTASIAGLHVTPTLGGYTVTKFALLALMETLAAELRDDGDDIGLTLLCPGPVSTNLGASQRNRPAGLDGAMVDSNLEETEEGSRLRWMGPDEIAGILLQAMKRGELYAFTHPEMAPLVLERHQRIAEALAADTET